MDDIVAVAVRRDEGLDCYFLTWGRIQATVDPEPLQDLLMRVVSKFATPGRAVSAKVCNTLREASGEPYFYECFFGMCQKQIPFGTDYNAWRAKVAREMETGKQIWFCGSPSVDT